MTFLLISFTLQAVYIVGQIRRELRAIQGENFSIIAKSFADMLELEVEGNENLLQGFATALSSMDDLSGMNYEKLLNKVQNSNRCYETVFMRI